MCGFPQETDEEFEETYKFLEEIKLYKIHMFKYSMREGTLAAKMPRQVEPDKKEERGRKILELSDKIQKQYNEKCIGKVLEVLVEDQEEQKYKGHTKNYMYVEIENCKNDIKNQIVRVKINRTENEMLIGEIYD